MQGAIKVKPCWARNVGRRGTVIEMLIFEKFPTILDHRWRMPVDSVLSDLRTNLRLLCFALLISLAPQFS